MREQTAAEAFRELVTGRIEETKGIPWKISRISGHDSRLVNGIPYCSVEVTFATGVKYGVEAFGDESIELRKAAMGMKAAEGMPIVIA
jgi:hypothetical protein